MNTADKVIYIDEEMTEQKWQEYCQKIAEENRLKIQEAHKNRNSTAPKTLQ